jgi:2-polyprenyl-3-methyl-5-hydroxy-6-metoxy-1,4-benzoquinol methylase
MLTNYYADNYRGKGARHRIDREPGPWDGASVRARSQLEFVLGRKGSSDLTKPVTSWLDIGAGYGCLLDFARCCGITRTGAVEPDSHSRKRLVDQGHVVYEQPCDTGGLWDVISFSHVLEHLASPNEFLKEIGDLLSTDGYVFCEVPNVLDLDLERNDAPHLLFFTISSLLALFGKARFEILKIESCGPIAGRHNVIDEWSRRIAARVFTTPPAWIDRAVHPHFRYSSDGTGIWIRLLAQKADNPTWPLNAEVDAHRPHHL